LPPAVTGFAATNTNAMMQGAIVVDRKAFAGPDHGRVRARPPLDDVLGDFVDRHDGAAALVMTSDDAADCEAHRMFSLRIVGAEYHVPKAD
jgi:hypothetical protein